MKTILASIAATLTLSGCVNAQSQDAFTFVRVVHVQPNYATTHVNIPYTQCGMVNVPVYSKRNSGSGDVFTGMVIGGLVGNAIGGNDKSTALGAIIGGMAAAEPTPYISGYRTEQRCETVYTSQPQQILDGYTITYNHQNTNGVVYTPFYFQPGSLVSIRELNTGR
jgi:uncharacterized protein YcfJ